MKKYKTMVRRSGRQPKPTAKYSAYQQSMKQPLITTTTKKSKRPKNIKASSALTTVIKKVINSGEETKFKIDAPFNFNTGSNLSTWTQFNTRIASTNEVYMLIPKITQGVDDYQRIGNEIQPKSLTVKINAAVGGLTSLSIYVDFYFVTSKKTKDVQLTNQIPTGLLLNDGQGSNVAYAGDSYTAAFPVNTSEFNVIKRKRVLLMKQNGDPNLLYSGGATLNGTTSTCVHFKSFSVKVPLPKKLKYEAAASTSPTNYFPFMMAGFHATDQLGGTVLLPALLPLYIQAQSHMYFKDA